MAISLDTKAACDGFNPHLKVFKNTENISE